MKPFQRILLAPVAVGLVSPLAASAADLNIGGVNQYSGVNQFVLTPQDQVTSISQFSDVRPTDWAYQALNNLIENYGCVAGYPSGSYKGGQPLSRYEAAALLNSCLDRVTEVTDEVKRLLGEFQKELSVIRGRVDKLENKVGKLEAQQFSTTTKLQGDSYWSIGANAFGNRTTPAGPAGTNGYAANRASSGGTVFNYDLRLNLNTSFTGKDLLYTRLRAANYDGSPFSGSPYRLMGLDRAFPGSTQGTGASNNIFYLDRLYYRFPIGKEFTATVGPIARNTESLAITPFYYGGWSGLDLFTLHGAPGTYNKATGGLAGLIWKQNVKKGQPFFAISTSYVAPGANNGNPANVTNPANSTGSGLFGDYSAGSWLTQIGYQASQWKATAAWRYGQCNERIARRGTVAAGGSLACTVAGTNDENSFALALAWQPKTNGTLIPSISVGWGYNSISQPGNAVTPTTAWNNAANVAATQSWTVAFQWQDAFVKGNAAGLAVGQPTFVTRTRNGATPYDGNYAIEGWYKFQVSDNISVTPLLFYLSNPSSATNTTAGVNTGANVFGGLLTAQFKF
jgi:hypothetical protein